MAGSKREFSTGDVVVKIGDTCQRMVLWTTDTFYYLSFALVEPKREFVEKLIARGTGTVARHDDLKRNYINICHWNGVKMEGLDEY